VGLIDLFEENAELHFEREWCERRDEVNRIMLWRAWSEDEVKKAAQALEWGRFLELAERQARTERGRALVRALESEDAWARDLASAQQMQRETHECAGLLDRDSLWGPLTDLGDPEPALDRLGRGAVLELEELALVRRWLYAVDSWSQLPREELRGELFKQALERLPDVRAPLRVLERVLTPEGELSERATPRLAQLHQEIRSLKREIGVVLDQLLRSYGAQGVLQESFSDVRDGRFVLPVKISSQSAVDGTLYEASASRQTVFIEPREVGGLNNRLRKAQNDLLQEIYAVLLDTSKQLQPHAGETLGAVLVLAHWDAVQAKARLGLRYSGKTIRVTEERAFSLPHTAHPLLYWSIGDERIIRNQVDFGAPTRTLLLTGPNTGGKTVLLKTLGLAAFCARTGFPFPASDEPQVPFFGSVFADLGDNQSIEEHLSSFSGHIVRFKEILEGTTARSLVLIDELNSATDPEEGAALGRAFLETVMGRGALIVTTTHDPHLKAAAVSDHRILNASMQFDEGSRMPTYKIVLGVPGRSRALETAERLGIPAEVLKLARTYLSREHLEFEAMLSKLESDSRETERARLEAEQLREEASKLKAEWVEKAGAATHEMLERTRGRLRRVLEGAQDEMRASMHKLDELKHKQAFEEARAKIQAAFGQSSAGIDAALGQEAPELAAELGGLPGKGGSARSGQTGAQDAADAIGVGSFVRIPKWKSTGTVLELHGGKAKVQMGKIQMSLALSELEAMPISEIEKLPKAQRPAGFDLARGKGGGGIGGGVGSTYAPPSEIDLRGQRFDDAMSQLRSYLDMAYRSGALAEVTVIHGLGTGAIREGARKLLGKLPYVKSFNDGGVGRGGSGATVVEFDRS
jgi:DNA mismatch repair protein MutS2